MIKFVTINQRFRDFLLQILAVTYQQSITYDQP